MTTDTNAWPKGRLDCNSPDDPDHGRIFEQAEWDGLGVDDSSAENLRSGALAGTGVRHPDGTGFRGMLQRYTEDDCLRDAATDLLAALEAQERVSELVEDMRHAGEGTANWHRMADALDTTQDEAAALRHAAIAKATGRRTQA